MSSVQSVDAKCPKCGAGFKQTIHGSVNVTLDPALKARVLSADIFRVTCPSCGHVAHAQYDCVYHDMQRVLMMSLTSAEGLEVKKAALAQGMAALPHLELYCLRIVHTVHDLFEKILIFDAELNDGIVELLKIVLPGDNPALKDAQLRFQAIDDAGALAYAVIRAGQRPSFVSVPRDYYDAVRTKAFDDLAKLADARGEFLVIDRDSVGRYMATKMRAPG